MRSREGPIVICLTSHDRIDCARINQEIIKLNYKTPFKVVHACSGAQKERYLEDELVWCAPKPLHHGSINLIQRSLRVAVEVFDPSYVVHLEADTWLLEEGVLLDYLRRMKDDPSLLLATSAWQSPSRYAFVRGVREIGDIARTPRGAMRRLLDLPKRVASDIQDFATQFFILRNHPRLVDCILSMSLDDRRDAERRLFDAFTREFDLDRVLRMVEREPVFPHRRWMCEKIALYSQHWPAAGTSIELRPASHPLYIKPTTIGKKEALVKHPGLRNGDALNRLLSATDYGYYNPGASRGEVARS